MKRNSNSTTSTPSSRSSSVQNAYKQEDADIDSTTPLLITVKASTAEEGIVTSSTAVPTYSSFRIAAVLCITFLTFVTYHAARKANSIVKSTLDPENGGKGGGGDDDINPNGMNNAGKIESGNPSDGWAPFNHPGGEQLLAYLDTTFLLTYSIGTFVCGHIADHINNTKDHRPHHEKTHAAGDDKSLAKPVASATHGHHLRWFLTVGLFGSAIAQAMFGMGYFLNIHHMWYYTGVSCLQGLFQSTGWPSLLAILSNWLGKSEHKGLIMGIWTANCQLGNIVGSVVAGAVLDYGWGYSFVVFAFMMAIVGVICGTCLETNPPPHYHHHHHHHRSDRTSEQLAIVEYGACSGVVPDNKKNKPLLAAVEADNHPLAGSEKCTVDQEEVELEEEEEEEDFKSSSSSSSDDDDEEEEDEGFVQALCRGFSIPGVVEFALCFFCVKLVMYSFLYWLPFFLSGAEIGGKGVSEESAANLSTLFDFGGMFGGALAGFLFDKTGKRPGMCVLMYMWATIPSIALFMYYGDRNYSLLIASLFVVGFFAQGAAGMLSTVVSEHLGTSSAALCIAINASGNNNNGKKGSVLPISSSSATASNPSSHAISSVTTGTTVSTTTTTPDAPVPHPHHHKKMVSTVCGVLDGIGSLGAALGPLITGYVSCVHLSFGGLGDDPEEEMSRGHHHHHHLRYPYNHGHDIMNASSSNSVGNSFWEVDRDTGATMISGWNLVFYTLMLVELIGGCVVLRIAYREIRSLIRTSRARSKKRAGKARKKSSTTRYSRSRRYGKSIKRSVQNNMMAPRSTTTTTGSV
eukprot:Nk52_evm6s212 gene=Nk52_evmTU6s212